MKITAYFSTTGKARDAVEALRSKGFTKVRLDMNDHYNDERNVRTNLAGTEEGPSLSGLTLKSGPHDVDRSKTPLMAASPMASGMGTFDEIADFNATLKVEFPEKDKHEVRKILENSGGELDNPNVPNPNGFQEFPME